MKTQKTQTELISEIYDYIVKVTTFQNKLLPVSVLYGDGTRWEKKYDIFNTVYNNIKKILEENNLTD